MKTNLAEARRVSNPWSDKQKDERSKLFDLLSQYEDAVAKLEDAQSKESDARSVATRALNETNRLAKQIREITDNTVTEGR